MADSSPSFRQNLYAKSGMLLFLPGIWALVSYVQGAAPQPIAPGAAKPALVFNQYLVDLGKVPPQRFVQAYFQFTNRGKQAVDVTELLPSCGCLSPRLEKRHYEPGEIGEFFLKIDAAQEVPGPHEYFVDINYTDPRPQTARVTFKLDLPYRSVLIEPPAVMFYQLNPVASVQEVVITNLRPMPMQVTGIRSTLDFVDAEVVGSDVDDGVQKIRAKIRVPAVVPSGRRSGMVIIETDDVEYSQIGVHVLIQGPESKVRVVGHEEEAGGGEKK